jgi:hypothetical protein
MAAFPSPVALILRGISRCVGARLKKANKVIRELTGIKVIRVIKGPAVIKGSKVILERMALGIKVIQVIKVHRVSKVYREPKGFKVILERMALGIKGIKVIKVIKVSRGTKARRAVETLEWKETHYKYYLLEQTTEAPQSSRVVHHIFI